MVHERVIADRAAAVTVQGMTAATSEIRGNALDGIVGLLDGLGIVRAETRDSVEDVVAAELAARHIDAQVLELKFGTLVLSASPQAAQLLRYEADRLRATLEERMPGAVRDVKIRVRRR